MKLLRSKQGRVLIPLYYGAAGLGCLLVLLVVMVKFGVLAGLGIGLLLGIVIGITGGEIEYRIHIREQYRLRNRYGVGSLPDVFQTKEKLWIFSKK